MIRGRASGGRFGRVHGRNLPRTVRRSGLKGCTRSLGGAVEGDWLRVFEVPVPLDDGAGTDPRVKGQAPRRLGASPLTLVPTFSYTLSALGRLDRPAGGAHRVVAAIDVHDLA